MSEKKQDFVVSDRRRFAPEGDVRPEAAAAADAREEKEAREEGGPQKPAAPVAAAAPPVPVAQSAPPSASAEEAESQEMPDPPTAEEQREQDEAYKASGIKLDSMLGVPERGPAAEMTFERVVESFYMSALIQMGAIRPEGTQPNIDIIGARQTIDSLSVLQEKTRGNLTDRERVLLQNVVFELRMAWIEITNAIGKAPPPQGPGAPGIAGPGIPPGGGLIK
jgi:hypothetical protein